MNSQKELYRSSQNKIIAGVCSGIAGYFNVEPIWVRLFFVVGSFILGGLPIIVYFIIWAVVPTDENFKTHEEPSRKSDDPSTPPNKETQQNQSYYDHKHASTQTKKPWRLVFPILFAILLIGMGVAIIIPDSLSTVLGALLDIFALLMILVSIRMLWSVYVEKRGSFLLISLAYITLTLSVFIILTHYGQIYGMVYLMYLKYLIPSIFIVAGVGLLAHTLKKMVHGKIYQWIGVGTGTAIYITIAILAVVWGNHPLNIEMPSWMKYINPSYWIEEQSLEIGEETAGVVIPRSVGLVEYAIENAAGNLDITAGKKDIDYDTQGITPEINTNISQKSFIYEFNNRGANTDLYLDNSIPCSIEATLNAGKLTADLSEIPVHKIEIDINAGAAVFTIGDQCESINASVGAGDLILKLPSQVNINLNSFSTFASVDVPDEFMKSEGYYMYQAGTFLDKSMDVYISVSMGSVTIELY